MTYPRALALLAAVIFLVGLWRLAVRDGEESVGKDLDDPTSRSDRELARLEADPDRLGDLVEKPEGTPERTAVRRFLKTRTGAEKLVEIYVRDQLDLLTLDDFGKAAFGMATRPRGEWEVWFSIAGSARGGSGGNRLCKERRLLEVRPLLSEVDLLDVGELTFPAYPGKAFRVLPNDVAFLASGLRWNGGDPKASEPVCVARDVRAGEAGREWLGPEAIPGLLEAAKANDSRLRDLALQVLDRAGIDADDSAAALAGGLRGDRRSREAIIGALKERPDDAAMMLRKALDQGDRETGLAAIHALRRAGPDAREGIAALVAAARDHDRLVQAAAASALAAVGPDGLSALRSLVGDREGETPRIAIRAIGEMGPKAIAAVPDIQAIAEDEAQRVDVRRAAAEALKRIDPTTVVRSPAPSASPRSPRPPPVDSESIATRQAAIREIDEARFTARLPELIRLLALESDPETRLLGSAALRSFGKEALPAFAAALESEDASTQALAVIFASELGPEAVPLLTKALEIPEVRALAATYLRQLGPQAKAALPALERSLAAGNYAAGFAIYGLDPRHAQAVVEGCLATMTKLGRVAADGAAKELASTVGDDAVPHLKAALLHEDLAIREAAENVLARIEARRRGAGAGTGPGNRSRSVPVSSRSISADEPVPHATFDVATAEGREACLEALSGDDLDRAFDAVVALEPVVGSLPRVELGRALAGLLDRLREDPSTAPSPNARYTRVADLLVRLRLDAETVLPTLMRHLRAENKAVRGHAMEAIGRMGADAQTAIPALVESLEVRNRELRMSAARALERMGPPAKDTISALIRALRFGDRLYALHGSPQAEAIAAVGVEAVPALARALEEEDPLVRQGAAEALGEIGPPAAEAAPALAALVGDESLATRVHVARALVLVGGGTEAALAVLERALREASEAGERELVHWAVDCLGPEAATLVPALIELIDAGDSEATSHAIRNLANIGSAAARAVPALLELLDRAEGPAVPEACGALGRIDAGDDRVVPALTRVVEGGKPQAVASALDALAALGPKASAAVPAILRALEADPIDPEALETNSVGPRSLSRGRLPPHLLAVRRDLLHRRMVEAAARALGAIGPAASDGLPALRALLDDDEPSTRLVGAGALWKVGCDAEDIIPVLLEHLEDREMTAMGDSGIRWSRVFQRAARVVALLGPDAAEVVPLLLERFRGSNVPERCEAARALWSVGAFRDEALAELLEAASDPDPGVRLVAMRLLAEIVAEAPEAASCVEYLREDPVARVRSFTRRTVETMERERASGHADGRSK